MNQNTWFLWRIIPRPPFHRRGAGTLGNYWNCAARLRPRYRLAKPLFPISVSSLCLYASAVNTLFPWNPPKGISWKKTERSDSTLGEAEGRGLQMMPWAEEAEGNSGGRWAGEPEAGGI